MNGPLIKLTIIPFLDSKLVQVPIPIGVPIIVPFNPESLNITSDFEYATEEKLATVGSEATFERVYPRKFSFDIFLDGTGASGPKLPIHPIIKLFELASGVIGSIHRPQYFMISWGTTLLKCVIKSYSISYKMFSPQGVPLRAVISTEWQELLEEEETMKWLNLLSPDVTHLHEVKEGDMLSLTTFRTYKDSKYYYQVAEQNKLNNLRRLNNSEKIKLPPLV